MDDIYHKLVCIGIFTVHRSLVRELALSRSPYSTSSTQGSEPWIYTLFASRPAQGQPREREKNSCSTAATHKCNLREPEPSHVQT